MTRIFFNKVEKHPSPLSTLAILGAVAAAIFMVAAGPGYVSGLWGDGANSGPDISRRVDLVTWALFAAGGGAVLAVAGFLHALFAATRSSGLRTPFALFLSAAVLAPILMMLKGADTNPFIHDVTTDLDNPPRFLTLTPRLYDPNGERGLMGGPFAENYRTLHSEGYPDLAPVTLNMSVDQAFEKARATAEQLGWSIADAAPAAGRIEATVVTRWFGFQDNVALRIRPADGGSVIDVRSVSVVGISDLGANAARIKAFIAAISADS